MILSETVIDFINEYDYMIDEEDWRSFLMQVYSELGLGASHICVKMLKDTLSKTSVDAITKEQNILLKDRFYELYSIWNHEKVQISHILQTFRNFYGYTYAEATKVAIEEFGLNVEQINGGYVISDV